jgi:hypothetical protein
MKFFTYTVIGIVAVAVIAGFFVVGSPKEERMRRFDGERVAHLQQLQWNIIEYWQSKGKLPAKLADLNDPTRGVIVPSDPETGESYGYEIKKPETFNLCATFQTETISENVSSRIAKPIPAEPFGGIRDGDVWTHSAGRVCFDRTIDKDFFQLRKSQ